MSFVSPRICSVFFSHLSSSRETSNSSGKQDLIPPRVMYQLFFFSFLGHDGSVTSVNFSHDNNWLLTSSCDRTVRLWNPAHSDPLLIFSSVNHNFVSELGSAAKLKVSAEVLVSFLPLSIGSDNRELISSDDGNGNVNVT